jgi:hypothetical protein
MILVGRLYRNVVYLSSARSGVSEFGVRESFIERSASRLGSRFAMKVPAKRKAPAVEEAAALL